MKSGRTGVLPPQEPGILGSAMSQGRRYPRSPYSVASDSLCRPGCVDCPADALEGACLPLPRWAGAQEVPQKYHLAQAWTRRQQRCQRRVKMAAQPMAASTIQRLLVGCWVDLAHLGGMLCPLVLQKPCLALLLKTSCQSQAPIILLRSTCMWGHRQVGGHLLGSLGRKASDVEPLESICQNLNCQEGPFMFWGTWQWPQHSDQPQ